MSSYDPFRAVDDFAVEQWEKPALCSGDGDNCVEVNRSLDGAVGIRDSKSAGSPVLVFTAAEWGDFLRSARAGQYGG
jgi:hypothetical protein